MDHLNLVWTLLAQKEKKENVQTPKWNEWKRQKIVH